MTHAELIQRLGGNLALASKLHRDQTSVCRWKRDGIPPELWHRVVRIAAKQGVAISVDRLAATHPRLARRRRTTRRAPPPPPVPVATEPAIA